MFLRVRVVPGTCRHEADSELPAMWQPSSWERTLLAPVTVRQADTPAENGDKMQTMVTPESVLFAHVAEW